MNGFRPHRRPNSRACELDGTIGDDEFGPFKLICMRGRKACRGHAKVDPDFATPIVNWHLCEGYASATPSRTTRVVLHRIIIGAADNQHVDHVNGDRLDNRKANLRLVTPRLNSYNRVGRGAASKYKGVSPNRAATDGCWRISVGGFASEEDAARAFDEVSRRYHGAHATYNFPRSGERSAVIGEIEP